jgi:pyruvate kinase
MLVKNFSKTKVVCTIGPAVNSLDRIIQLQNIGMNVARLNFSHGTHPQHLQTIKLLKEAREKTALPLAIMLDTKGPEIRVGKLEDDEVELHLKQRVFLTAKEIEGNKEMISLTPGSVLEDLKEGDLILFDDGYISSHVVQKRPDGVVVEIDHPGILRSSKGVNIPDTSLNLPAVTEKDIEDIKLGCEQEVDIVAASFIRSREHVLEIRELLRKFGGEKIRLYAKIENREGVTNFEEILAEVDGIIIARGDLGVEIKISEVPPLQKKMIRMSCSQGKPTLTATQMLESMIYNPRPTRAEASDVANAIFDSSSAVMLSGETAMGRYPFEAVRTMKEIIQAAEEEFDYKLFYKSYMDQIVFDLAAAVASASVKTAMTTRAKAIFCFTTSGFTARCLSRVRPPIPILALTTDEKVYHQMASNWGVCPLYANSVRSIEEAYGKVSSYALKEGFVSIGDLVIIVAGSPFGVAGTTNMMLLETIGDVLFRAQGGQGKIVQGRLFICEDIEKAKTSDIEGAIVLIRECKDQYEAKLKKAKGLILCNESTDHGSPASIIEIAKRNNLSIIWGVDVLLAPDVEPGKWVTLDPESLIMFENYFHEGRDSRISHPLF